MKQNFSKYSILKGDNYCFFSIKYLEINYNCIHFKLKYQIKFYKSQTIY